MWNYSHGMHHKTLGSSQLTTIDTICFFLPPFLSITFSLSYCFSSPNHVFSLPMVNLSQDTAVPKGGSWPTIGYLNQTIPYRGSGPVMGIPLASQWSWHHGHQGYHGHHPLLGGGRKSHWPPAGSGRSAAPSAILPFAGKSPDLCSKHSSGFLATSCGAPINVHTLGNSAFQYSP